VSPPLSHSDRSVVPWLGADIGRRGLPSCSTPNEVMREKMVILLPLHSSTSLRSRLCRLRVRPSRKLATNSALQMSVPTVCYSHLPRLCLFSQPQCKFDITALYSGLAANMATRVCDSQSECMAICSQILGIGGPRRMASDSNPPQNSTEPMLTIASPVLSPVLYALWAPILRVLPTKFENRLSGALSP
jgi:hypothetical protein